MDRWTAALVVALSSLAATALAARSVVDPFRARVLLGPDGKSASLAEQARGGRLVVVTMKGHWCEVCLGELARMSALRHRLAALDTRVVGLDADTPRANDAAAREVGIKVPILGDASRRVLRALGLWLEEASHPVPAIVVFDECGQERGRFVGRSPGESGEKPLVAMLEKIAAAPPRCVPEGNT